MVTERAVASPASLSNRLLMSLSSAVAEPRMPHPASGMQATSASPGRSRPRHAAHAIPETEYRSWAGHRQCHGSAARSPARVRPAPGRAAFRSPASTGCHPRTELTSHLPSRVMKTGTASYRSPSSARMTFVAERTDTSCSAERPPNSTAMRSFGGAEVVCHQRSLRSDGKPVSWVSRLFAQRTGST